MILLLILLSLPTWEPSMDRQGISPKTPYKTELLCVCGYDMPFCIGVLKIQPY